MTNGIRLSIINSNRKKLRKEGVNRRVTFREKIGLVAMCEVFGTGLLKQSFQRENLSCVTEIQYVTTCAGVNGFE